MKFLDTNIFLRYLVAPETTEDQRKYERCLSLFQDAEAGRVEITTSESVFHEVLYVLCSSRQYRLSHVEAASRIRPLLALRAFHLRQKRLFFQALELFATYNFLDFADAMSIAHVQATKAELLSYDTDFDKVAGIARIEP